LDANRELCGHRAGGVAGHGDLVAVDETAVGIAEARVDSFDRIDVVEQKLDVGETIGGLDLLGVVAGIGEEGAGRIGVGSLLQFDRIAMSGVDHDVAVAGPELGEIGEGGAATAHAVGEDDEGEGRVGWLGLVDRIANGEADRGLKVLLAGFVAEDVAVDGCDLEGALGGLPARSCSRRTCGRRGVLGIRRWATQPAPRKQGEQLARSCERADARHGLAPRGRG
jgi:hypothetical protein